MAGIYVHIPYCKQACHYCDFHFSTNLNTKSDLIDAILKEIQLRHTYLGDDLIETIYFGGGTPSLLNKSEIESILLTIKDNFRITNELEVTLEANPDDLIEDKLKELKQIGINRLSIGIQSFDNNLLSFFNRAHDAEIAEKSVLLAQQKGFDNISIDLIFGAPNQSNEQLLQDLSKAISLKTQHISIYGLTIEEETVFGKWEKQHRLTALDEDIAAKHLVTIMEKLTEADFTQYEISNFCQPGYHSKHNSSYWRNKKYLGIGPAAHSFNGTERSFNISHNIKYISQIKEGVLPQTIEKLSSTDMVNDIILTQLRLAEGLNLNELENRWQIRLLQEKQTHIDQFEEMKMIEIEENFLRLTTKGKLLADFITEKLII